MVSGDPTALETTFPSHYLAYGQGTSGNQAVTGVRLLGGVPGQSPRGMAAKLWCHGDFCYVGPRAVRGAFVPIPHAVFAHFRSSLRDNLIFLPRSRRNSQRNCGEHGRSGSVAGDKHSLHFGLSIDGENCEPAVYLRSRWNVMLRTLPSVFCILPLHAIQAGETSFVIEIFADSAPSVYSFKTSTPSDGLLPVSS